MHSFRATTITLTVSFKLVSFNIYHYVLFLNNTTLVSVFKMILSVLTLLEW